MAVCNLSELVQQVNKGQSLLGLDPGSVAIGVAVSDPGFSIASPLTTITRTNIKADATALLKIVKDRQIGGLIVGLPKNMDGSEGPSAQSARALVRNLVEKGGLDAAMPVVFWDERLSTAAVERFMVEDNMSRKRRDQVIDKAAAAYILQGALDAIRHQLAVKAKES